MHTKRETRSHTDIFLAALESLLVDFVFVECALDLFEQCGHQMAVVVVDCLGQVILEVAGR